jgi:hypothetical protein
MKYVLHSAFAKKLSSHGRPQASRQPARAQEPGPASLGHPHPSMAMARPGRPVVGHGWPTGGQQPAVAGQTRPQPPWPSGQRSQLAGVPRGGHKSPRAKMNESRLWITSSLGLRRQRWAPRRRVVDGAREKKHRKKDIMREKSCHGKDTRVMESADISAQRGKLSKCQKIGRLDWKMLERCFF